ncbi:MAG TPA: phosphoribosylformylglycinamidine synthase subunit PurS [bacterium]
MLEAKIYITLRSGILDTQGKAIHHALENLGFAQIGSVRIGKFLQLEFAEDIRKPEAERLTVEACKKLLANPVIEDYRFELLEAPSNETSATP